MVVWNCRMGLARKLDALLELRPDVAILPEAGDQSRLSTSVLKAHGLSYVWIGRNHTKGLGVLVRAPYQLTAAPDLDSSLEWVLPLRITGPMSFTLLAVWAMNHRASNKKPGEGQLRQVDRAIDLFENALRAGPLVVAGDFNNAVHWDRRGRPDAPGNFAVTAGRLESLGLVSAYHATRGVDFGAERDPTIYWQSNTIDGPTFHIDYCFVPAAWTDHIRVDVGAFADWVGTRLILIERWRMHPAEPFWGSFAIFRRVQETAQRVTGGAGLSLPSASSSSSSSSSSTLRRRLGILYVHPRAPDAIANTSATHNHGPVYVSCRKTLTISVSRISMHAAVMMTRNHAGG